MKVAKRRRREGKTDYKARRELLKSKLLRIVIRKTNKYIILQYTESREAKDKVILSVSSKKLLDFGWPKKFSGSLKSLAASYLSGLLLGKMIKERKGEVKVILDSGLLRNKPKGRIYAAVRGIINAGIKINCEEKMLPDLERIKTSSKKSIDIGKIENKIKNG